MSYKLSVAAKSDLREIYVYSMKEFGEEQSDKYLESLYSVFDTISRNPEIGLNPDFETHSNVKKFPVLKHVIYYLIAPENIEIRRIFHGSREVELVEMGAFQ